MRDKTRVDWAWEIWRWQHGADNFTSQLFALFAKGDHVNLGKLYRAFPQEGSIWEEWYNSESEDAFYERYGIKEGASHHDANNSN